MKVSNFIILGPQGSGKGTQAKLLQGGFGFVVLGSGDAFREIAKQDSDLGRKVHQLIHIEGKLIDDELTAEVMKNKILSVPKEKPIILDGFPRTVRQYELMKEFWQEMGRGEYGAILVELSEEEAIRRLATRLTCENCGAIYIAGKAPDKCTRCGGKLITRPDDKPEAIKKRLELFNEQTRPLIQVLEKEGELIRIDGSPPIEDVHQEILEKLELK